MFKHKEINVNRSRHHSIRGNISPEEGYRLSFNSVSIFDGLNQAPRDLLLSRHFSRHPCKEATHP